MLIINFVNHGLHEMNAEAPGVPVLDRQVEIYWCGFRHIKRDIFEVDQLHYGIPLFDTKRDRDLVWTQGIILDHVSENLLDSKLQCKS